MTHGNSSQLQRGSYDLMATLFTVRKLYGQTSVTKYQSSVGQSSPNFEEMKEILFVVLNFLAFVCSAFFRKIFAGRNSTRKYTALESNIFGEGFIKF